MAGVYRVLAAAVCLVSLTVAFHLADEEQLDRLRSVSRVSRQKRVIGGVPIEEGDWPYLVRLKGKVPTKFFWGIPYSYKYYYCGAAVLNNRWLLTAAHCFKQAGYPSRAMTPKYWHAKIGEIFSHNHWWDFLTGGQDIHLKKITLHPSYNPSQLWKHDIAVVKLDESTDATPVNLPAADLDDWPSVGEPYGDCIFKGWGCTSSGAGLEDIANAVHLPYVSDSECQSIYGASTETRLCAGMTSGNTGICSGDSGGPLVCPYEQNGQTIYAQAGVASFTSASSPGSYPGVFTRVTEYVNWINNNIN